MNTECLFFSVVLIYMLVNVWTDTRYLKTKNEWHLLIGGFFFVVGTINDLSFLLLITIVITLFFGVMLSKVPHTTLGAGDTKMLMVVATYFQNVNPSINPLILVLIIICVYIIFSFIQVSLFQTVAFFLKRDLSFFSYRTEGKKVITPEAFPILITVILISQLLGGN